MFSKSLIGNAIKLFSWRRGESIQSSWHSLQEFDFNNDMRIIGKPYRIWGKLRRLRNSFKLMVSQKLRRSQSKIPPLIFGENRVHKSKLVIMPGSTIDMVSNFIIGIAYILSFFLTSLVLGTKYAILKDVYYIEIIIDIILLFDIILRFITAYEYDCEYVKIINNKDI